MDVSLFSPDPPFSPPSTRKKHRSSASVDVVAEKSQELAEQEKLFLKCLRKRAEREAKRKQEKEEKRAIAKKLKEEALGSARFFLYSVFFRLKE